MKIKKIEVGGDTALDLALWNERMDIVDLLKSYGAKEASMKIKKIEVGGEPTVGEIMGLLGGLPEETLSYRLIVRTEGPPCYVSNVKVDDEEHTVELS